jgi:acylphosphatase
MQRVIIKVFGQVQGVGFRWYTRRMAQDLGLTGWVCNEPDDSVKILAEGERDKLEKLVDWCRQGPESAQIDNVEAEWTKTKEEFKDFTVKLNQV